MKREIPLALIATIIGQTIGFIIAGSILFAQVQEHEKQIALLVQADNTQSLEIRRASETLARLDERIQAQNAILQRLDIALTRLTIPGPRIDR